MFPRFLHPDYRNVILSEAAYGGLPVAYWPLDEVNGTTAVDASGNGENGTYTGGVTLGAQGPIARTLSRAATFDGSSGYVALPAGSYWILPEMTLEAWFCSTVSGSPEIIDRDHDGDGGVRHFQFTTLPSGGVQFILFDSGGNPHFFNSSNTVSLNQYNHAAVSYDGTTVTIVLNGVVTTASATITPPSNSVNNARIATHSDSHFAAAFFTGQISHAAVYSYAVATNRLQYHYLAGVNGIYPGAIAA